MTLRGFGLLLKNKNFHAPLIYKSHCSVQLSFVLAWETSLSLGHCLLGGTNNSSVSYLSSLRLCKVPRRVFLYTSLRLLKERKGGATGMGIIDLGWLGSLAASPTSGWVGAWKPQAGTPSSGAASHRAWRRAVAGSQLFLQKNITSLLLYPPAPKGPVCFLAVPIVPLPGEGHSAKCRPAPRGLA